LLSAENLAFFLRTKSPEVTKNRRLITLEKKLSWLSGFILPLHRQRCPKGKRSDLSLRLRNSYDRQIKEEGDFT
jgi:hypothetical protein